MNLLRERELSVCFLSEVLHISQPKISRHLAYLRNAQIVSARRDGKWIYYSIVEVKDFYAAQILQNTLEWLEDDERMRQDYNKLMLILTSPNAPTVTETISKTDISPQPHISNNRRSEIETYLL